MCNMDFKRFFALLLFYHLCSIYTCQKFTTNDELSEEVRFMRTDLALFAEESIVKEELIVREILELKRAVFLLKRLLGEKPTRKRGRTGIDQDGMGVNKLKLLEIRIETLEAENKEKNKKMLELEKIIRKLRTSSEKVKNN